jgi:hypothetical protein
VQGDFNKARQCDVMGGGATDPEPASGGTAQSTE